MNRREAIAALVALPEVARVSVANVKAADVIVVECDERVSYQAAEHIRTIMKEIWPDNKVVVCDGGTRIKVVEG